jgi:hypothetical protein
LGQPQCLYWRRCLYSNSVCGESDLWGSQSSVICSSALAITDYLGARILLALRALVYSPNGIAQKDYFAWVKGTFRTKSQADQSRGLLKEELRAYHAVALGRCLSPSDVREGWNCNWEAGEKNLAFQDRGYRAGAVQEEADASLAEISNLCFRHALVILSESGVRNLLNDHLASDSVSRGLAMFLLSAGSHSTANKPEAFLTGNQSPESSSPVICWIGRYRAPSCRSNLLGLTLQGGLPAPFARVKFEVLGESSWNGARRAVSGRFSREFRSVCKRPFWS